MKQNEIIQQLSDEELKKQLVLSQGILIIISLVLSIVFFDSFTEWEIYFIWDFNQIFFYGVIPGIVIVGIDVILMKTIPKEYLNDGGINQRIFENQSVRYILFLSFLVAIAEELLFRGVIQTTFGYVFSCILFAVLHFRYLKKPILFISILIASFFIGFLFEITENLIVTIAAHITIDFLLGLIIRFK